MHAASPNKIGRDASELCGLTEPTGIVATDDIDALIATVERGRMAAVRFAAEGVRDGVPLITMEHITRLTLASAPDWEYPPDGKTGVHRVVVEGEPRVELNTHVSDPVLDVTEAGCVSTAARVVNGIDWIAGRQRD